MLTDLDKLNMSSKEQENKDSYKQALENFSGMGTWREIHALLEHEDFDPSPKWIARKLGLPINEVVDAMEGLHQLGIVGRDSDGNFYPKKLQIIMDSEVLSRKVIASNHQLVSQQVLNRFDPESEDNFFRAGYYMSNRELMEELRDNIKEAFRIFREKSKTAEKRDRLYGVTVVGTNILNESGDK
tara:strand:+ start:2739 stop:3293 length:555 start_codon:yes stop_codon:yes gene_type:complete